MKKRSLGLPLRGGGLPNLPNVEIVKLDQMSRKLPYYVDSACRELKKIRL